MARHRGWIEEAIPSALALWSEGGRKSPDAPRRGSCFEIAAQEQTVGGLRGVAAEAASCRTVPQARLVPRQRCAPPFAALSLPSRYLTCVRRAAQQFLASSAGTEMALVVSHNPTKTNDHTTRSSRAGTESARERAATL